MKLHPLSIPYRAVSQGFSVGVSLFFGGTALLGSRFEPPGLSEPVVIAVAIAGVALSAAWQVAYYRRFDYELADDELVLASGVVSRRDREIPLNRIQNVDISRNVVQRAVGIAALDLETAGGGRTEASLRFVGYGEAKRLQREIQRRKRTDRSPDGEAADGEDEARADREELLFELTGGELALLSVLSFDLRYFSLLAFGPATLPFVPGFAQLAIVSGTMLVATLLAGLWAISAVVTFARYYGFRLTRVDDELRYERGLVQRYDGSIPLAKVQALSLRENPLMRRFGYATLAVETAGYGPGQAPAGGSEAAIPLATRERVVRLAQEVEAFEPPTFARPPKRARSRYVARYAIAVGAATAVLFGTRRLFGWPELWYLSLLPLALVPLVPIAAHVKWRNRGYAVGDEHAFTRNGFWNRETKIVPHYRVQTVIQVQTVFQRRRRLASAVIDTASSAGGAAAAVDLDAETAAELRETVAERLQRSLLKRKQGAPDEP